MTDIYSAPESEVQMQSDSDGEYGSIEKGLEGDYDLSIGEVMSEAWSLTKGSKTTILVAALLLMVYSLVVSFAVGFIGGLLGTLGVVVGNIVLYAVLNPVSVGFMIIAIRRACKREASSTSIFEHFDKVVPLFITYLIMAIFIMIGFVLLIIPGIYLAIAYMYAMPLVVEKNMGPWEALETSRKIITKKWFNMFGLLLVFSIVVTVAALPLGIGLIWAVPWAVICMGIVYRNAFGVNSETLA